MSSGIILLNKPTGMSSAAAVAKVKRILHVNKVGHLGTLDPLGAGLLLITVGKATRLFDFFLKKSKTYYAIFKFGYETDTIDPEGEIKFSGGATVEEFQVESVLKSFIGKQYQMPPVYSAKKIEGKKAYEVARSGALPVLKAKEVEITSLNIVRRLSDNLYCFKIECSAGTYIRSLCRDIAYKLSTYGTMVSILRTKCGKFSLNDACNFDDLENGKFNLIPVSSAIDLPCLFLEDDHYKDISDGKKIVVSNKASGIYKVFCSNVFFGIGEVDQNSILKLSVYLKES